MHKDNEFWEFDIVRYLTCLKESMTARTIWKINSKL